MLDSGRMVGMPACSGRLLSFSVQEPGEKTGRFDMFVSFAHAKNGVWCSKISSLGLWFQVEPVGLEEKGGPHHSDHKLLRPGQLPSRAQAIASFRCHTPDGPSVHASNGLGKKHQEGTMSSPLKSRSPSSALLPFFF